MIRQVQFWYNALIRSTFSNPPVFIEGLMLLLAMVLLPIWFLAQKWPYLVLCCSYIIGASMSIFVRESILPSSQSQRNRIIVLLASVALLLTVCACGLV
ncbi:hypothetical protein MiSe_68600 [Microseira wollei NIES-4236]|uniref:Uncharacterized protein n=1 Tax=Microseira wollei NIES-4236 TaxID=2530354 RepID=A0AAV3XKJ8_9CYAN|nr:hypothetical protein MiSe_68600 [Microseira wollei NIES-4236]